MISCWLSSSILVLLVPTVAFESLATFCCYCWFNWPSLIFPSVKPTSTSMSFLPVRYSYPTSCCRWLVLPSPLRYPYLRIACPCPEPSSLPLIQANSVVFTQSLNHIDKAKMILQNITQATDTNLKGNSSFLGIPNHVPEMLLIFPQCSGIKSII